jgi:hypothetical protein
MQPAKLANQLDIPNTLRFEDGPGGLVRADGRLIKHARYYWLPLAESHLTRRLFGSMVRRIAALP